MANSLIVDEINNYFGTEYDDFSEFIHDFRFGDLADEFKNDTDRLISTLLFIRNLSKKL